MSMASEYLLPCGIAWYAINVLVMVRFITSLKQGTTHVVNRQNKRNTASMGVNIFIMKCHQGPEVSKVVHGSSGCGWQSFAIASRRRATTWKASVMLLDSSGIKVQQAVPTIAQTRQRVLQNLDGSPSPLSSPPQEVECLPVPKFNGRGLLGFGTAVLRAPAVHSLCQLASRVGSSRGCWDPARRTKLCQN